MSRTALLNGALLPLEAARVSVLDRGFVFGDGVYEVSAVLDGRLIDNDAHLARLARSLAAVGIPDPYGRETWVAHQEALIRRNELDEGIVYIQVTRGTAEREFHFPAAATTPTVVMFTQAKAIVDSRLARTGAAVITVPDLRWARRDIKSIALLAQVLAKQQAVAAGADEAFMVEDGVVTEGASSSAFIITGREIVTRPLSTAILPGITREALLRLARDEDLRIAERPFTVADCHAAAEVFYASASTIVAPVVSIDGRPVGSGGPGPLARQLRANYIDAARRSSTPR